MGWFGKLALGVGILAVGAIATAVLWVVWWFSPTKLEWKEEVALDDGRTLLVTRRVVMVPGGIWGAARRRAGAPPHLHPPHDRPSHYLGEW